MISTHAPAGGATIATEDEQSAYFISTHAPAGGATRFCIADRQQVSDISTHAPAGGATHIGQLSRAGIDISTHAPAGGATLHGRDRENGVWQFLLTPLREGRRVRNGERGCAPLISTHAPAGGATRSRPNTKTFPVYFYSRPCGRGDRPSSPWRASRKYFYSRPCGRGDWAGEFTVAGEVRFLLTPLREGRQKFLHQLEAQCDFYSRPCGRGDLRDFPVFHVGIAISTHAPAGGATIGPHSFRKVYAVISTHAPAGGATPVSHTEGEAIALFLLTPLREGRRGHGGHDINGAAYFYSRPCGRGDVDRLAEVVHEPNFYSRPCGRGDRRRGRQVRADQISTHAPAGGATSWCCALFLCMRISTHAPAGGATHRKLLPVRPYYISTHAPAGGATFRRLASTCRWSLFLLTPLREGRLAIFMILQLMTVYFYSRPCGRGDQTASVAKLGYQPISTHAPAGGATGVASV